MIKKEKVGGENVVVVYLSAKGQPCPKKLAKKVKVIYPTGRIVFGSLTA